MSSAMSVNETDEYFPSSNKASQANSLDQITSTSSRKEEHSMNYLHEQTSCHGGSLSKKCRIAMSSYTGNDQTGYQGASATWCGNSQLVCSSVGQPPQRSEAQQSLGNYTAASETAITQTTNPTLYTISNNQSTHRAVSTHSGHPVIEHSTQCVNDQPTHRVNDQPTHSSIGNKRTTTFISPYCTSSLNSGNTFSVLPAVKNVQTNQPLKPDEPTKKMFRKNDPSCFTRPACQFNSTPNTGFPHSQQPVPTFQFNSTPNTGSPHPQKPVPTCQFNPTPNTGSLHSQKPVPTFQFNSTPNTGSPHSQKPVPLPTFPFNSTPNIGSPHSQKPVPLPTFSFNPTPNTGSSHSQKPVPICQFNSTPNTGFPHSQKPVPTFPFNPTPNTGSSHSQKPVPIFQFNSTPNTGFPHSQKPVSTCQFNPTPNTGSLHFQRPVPDQPIPLPSKQPNREYSSFGPTEFQLTVSLDPCDGSTQNAEWMYRDTFGLEVALNPNTSSLLEHLYRPDSQLNAKFNMTLPETGRKYDISLKEMEMTDVCTGERIPLFRKTWTPHVQPRQTDLSNFPRLWSPQNKDIALISMDRRTEEYQAIEATFSRTMKSSSIVAVMRIQNKKLFVRYAFQKALLLDKNGGDENSVNEKLLFHGTSETPPDKIWHSEDGFDLRYCQRGMWGNGSYFAENASYSDQYAYCRCRYHMFESREMIVASVLTGNSIALPSGGMSTQLVRPPVYLQAKEDSPEVLYDSVTGFTGGSRIYVLYKLDMAYPSYLVRYFV